MASLNYQIIIGAKDQASSKLGKVRDSAERVAKQAAQLTAAFTAAGGAVLAFATRQIGAIDNMAKAARAAGVSAEALQELRFAAERSGASAQQLDEGLRRMNRRIGLAADGAGPAAKTLEQMGISVRDAGGNVRGTESILDEFIKKTSALGSQAEVAAAASALFGDDAGPKLALLLAEGESGIASLRGEAQKYGVVSNANAAQAEKTADAITNLKATFSDLGNTLTTAVAPILEQIARFLATAIPVAVTGAQVAINRLREVMVRALSLMAEKSQAFVDSILQWVPATSDVARSLGETSDRLRDFAADTGDLADVLTTDTNEALTDLDEVLTQIGEQTAPPAAQAVDQFTGSVESTGTAAVATVVDLEKLNETLEAGRIKADALAETLNPSGGGLPGLFMGLAEAILEAEEAMRVKALPTTSSLLEEFDKLASGTEFATSEVDDLKIEVEALAETKAPLEDWADALTAAFGNIEGSAGDAIRGIVGVIGSINQLQATQQQQGGTLNLAQQFQGGAQIGGFIGSAQGLGPSGQLGSSAGGAIGYVLRGPIGSVIGSIIGGSIFEDSGETTPRISVVNNQLLQGIRDGQPLQQYVTPFTRETALGVTLQGQQITEALGGAGAQQILASIAGFDQAVADIVRVSGRGNLGDIKAALLGPTGESSRVYEEGISIDAILSDRFNTVLQGFDQEVRNLVGTVTNAEDGFRRLGASITLLDELDTGPIEQYEEALRKAGLGVVESLQEQGDELTKLAENYNGSTADLERLAAGTQAFNQAVVATLASIDRASEAVGAITSGTLEGLEFRRIGQEEGQGAQIQFLLSRARQLRGEINTLDDADSIQRQVQLINNLVNQASGLIDPSQIGSFIDNVTPLLTSAEEIAKSRLDTIRESVEEVARSTGEAIRDAIAEPTETMRVAGQQMQGASQRIINAAERFQQGAARFGNKVDQFPAELVVSLSGSGEVNAAG